MQRVIRIASMGKEVDVLDALATFLALRNLSAMLAAETAANECAFMCENAIDCCASVLVLLLDYSHSLAYRGRNAARQRQA